GYPGPERLARQLAPTSAGDAGFRTRRWTGRSGAGRWFGVDAYRLGPATPHRHGAFDGDLRPAYWPAGDAGLRPGCWACALGALAASAALAAVGVRPGPGRGAVVRAAGRFRSAGAARLCDAGRGAALAPAFSTPWFLVALAGGVGDRPARRTAGQSASGL